MNSDSRVTKTNFYRVGYTPWNSKIIAQAIDFSNLKNNSIPNTDPIHTLSPYIILLKLVTPHNSIALSKIMKFIGFV